MLLLPVSTPQTDAPQYIRLARRHTDDGTHANTFSVDGCISMVATSSSALSRSPCRPHRRLVASIVVVAVVVSYRRRPRCRRAAHGIRNRYRTPPPRAYVDLINLLLLLRHSALSPPSSTPSLTTLHIPPTHTYPHTHRHTVPLTLLTLTHPYSHTHT